MASIYQQTCRKFHDAFEAWGKARVLRTRIGDRSGEIQALHEMGRLARDHFEDPAQAAVYLREGLDLAAVLGDAHRQGDLLNALGITEWKRGAYEQALVHYEAALVQYREAGDLAETALMLNSLGATLRSLRRYDEALARLQQAIHAAHQADHRPFLGYALATIGDVYRDKGEYAQALSHYRRSLEIRQEIGDRQGEAWMLHHLALAGFSDGQLEQACDWAEQASRLAESHGDSELIQACTRLRTQLRT